MPNINVSFVNNTKPFWNHNQSAGSRYAAVAGRAATKESYNSYVPFIAPEGVQNSDKLIYEVMRNLKLTLYANVTKGNIKLRYELYKGSSTSSGSMTYGYYTIDLEDTGGFTNGKLKIEIDITKLNIIPGETYTLQIRSYSDSGIRKGYYLDLGSAKSDWALYFYQSYKVSYDSNGGDEINESSGFSDSFTVTDTIPTRQNATSDTNFTITGSGGDSDVSITAVRTDTMQYTFLGWNTDKSATTVLYTAGQVVSGVSGDIILYAIWSSNIVNTQYSNNTIKELDNPSKSDVSEIYTITLNANGGTISDNELTCPVTKKYTFKEWIDNDGNIINRETQFFEDTIIYAVWNEYISGSVELPIPKKQGNIFLGWKESEEAADFVSNVYAPKEDCTLYAIYKVGYLIEAYIRLSNKWVKINMN